MTRNFSGKHMAIILVSFFGVVIVVNLVMARLAVSTFGGVVVENSYVASQEFNRWLEEAEAEAAPAGARGAGLRVPADARERAVPAVLPERAALDDPPLVVPVPEAKVRASADRRPPGRGA